MDLGFSSNYGRGILFSGSKVSPVVQSSGPVQQSSPVIQYCPSDGNCLFSACAHQLQSLGHDVVDASSLRQAVCQYLSQFGDYYSDFMHQSVASSDGYNADNEPPDEDDAYIESITDPVVQQELRYQKYVRRLSEGAWGDSIAISAMCNMLVILYQLKKYDSTAFRHYFYITKISSKHPDADTLYVEKIDIGM